MFQTRFPSLLASLGCSSPSCGTEILSSICMQICFRNQTFTHMLQSEPDICLIPCQAQKREHADVVWMTARTSGDRPQNTQESGWCYQNISVQKHRLQKYQICWVKKSHFKFFSEHILSCKNWITSTDVHATTTVYPSAAAQRGTSVCRNKIREFCTKQMVALEDTDSMYVTETAKASFYLKLNFGENEGCGFWPPFPTV